MADRTGGEPQIDGRSTRWDEHKAQRQVELVDAAVALIEEEGARFRVQRLAERVGLPRSVLYRHFKDRANLDELIRRRVVDLFMRRMEPTLTFDGTIEEAVRRVVGAAVPDAGTREPVPPHVVALEDRTAQRMPQRA